MSGRWRAARSTYVHVVQQYEGIEAGAELVRHALGPLLDPQAVDVLRELRDGQAGAEDLIARCCGMTVAQWTRVARELLAAGLIARRLAHSHPRRIRYELTATGRAVVDTLRGVTTV
jgi:DNA-binding HxlR family transcriptional regulator